MIEVRIPETIKVGGFDFKIEFSPQHDVELKENQNYGECSHRLKRIRIETDLSPQQLSETVIHEFVHAVDGVYCNYKLTEDETKQLGNGLLQILEQLGIRFVR